MMFFAFALDEEAQKMCTMVTPFGPFKYDKVPMSLVNSPDFAQAIMEEVLRGIDDTEIYIDDIGILVVLKSVRPFSLVRLAVLPFPLALVGGGGGGALFISTGCLALGVLQRADLLCQAQHGGRQ